MIYQGCNRKLITTVKLSSALELFLNKRSQILSFQNCFSIPSMWPFSPWLQGGYSTSRHLVVSQKGSGRKTTGKKCVAIIESVLLPFIVIRKNVFLKPQEVYFYWFSSDKAESHGQHLLQNIVNCQNGDHGKKKKKTNKPGLSEPGSRIEWLLSGHSAIHATDSFEVSFCLGYPINCTLKPIITQCRVPLHRSLMYTVLRPGLD